MMFKKSATIVMAAMLFMSSMTSIAAVGTETQAAVIAAADGGTYEVYPIPQKQAYTGTNFTITDQVNIVVEAGIDESTRQFLTNILESKSLQATQSSSAVADKTNVIIGTRNSNGYVDQYFNARITYDSQIFNENDAYVLAIDKELEAKGTIAILGASTDAAYYGLATLQMILGQMSGKEIKSVKYEDYADGKWRGFIEGFYGFPWSHEDRKSLMRFGGKLKMNTYIFAPKDDKYHNSAWRTLYPADELAKVKELVDVGHESKTQFVWAIHPGFSMINWNNYDAELQTLLTKLEQLYSVGVRQFGLFMDDISTGQSLADKDKHVKLITDVANWVTSKGDVKDLIYCPPFYNQAWTGETGKPYLQALRNVPENVEIMWTGRDVIGSVSVEENQWAKNEIGRDPYIWFNYPVNGYKKNRLLLGKVPMLHSGTHNFSGVVSNPLEQAELSKVALFGVADYTWNVDAFDNTQSWLDSFKYIEPEIAEEYNTIAYHMSDPSPNGRGVVFEESENIKDKLAALLSAFANGSPLQPLGTDLTVEFDRIIAAVEGFKTKSHNARLLKEIDPWINALYYVAQSGKYATQAAMAIQNNEMNAAWESLAKATNAMKQSQTFTRAVIGAQPQIAEAGAKRIAPYANQLIQKLDAQIYSAIDPGYTISIPVSSYTGVSLGNMVDGDPATHVYIQTKQVNGDWYGIDFGKSRKIRDIQIIQGRTDTDHDIFQRGILEYSLDGQSWTAIGDERSGHRVAAAGLDLDARYVRYRLTHAGIPGGKPDLWTAIREFAVNANEGKAGLYTNVSETGNASVAATDTAVTLSGLNGLKLEPNEYAGIQLPTIEAMSEITLNGSGLGGLQLQMSANGVEWKTVAAGGSVYPNAAYIRIMNNGDQAATLDIASLAATFKKFVDPVVTHNYEGVYQGNLAAVFDGKLDAKVWLRGRQTPGRFVQVDMGGVLNVQNAGVVINDGEGDYFRQGNLQLSVDGTNWETIASFNNPGDRSQNFPEHIAPYRYKRVQVDNKPARYIRLYTTVDNAGWLALNEIIVNEGIEKPGKESTVLQAVPLGETGNEAIYAADRKLSTYYMPKGNALPGTLKYNIHRQTKLSRVIILQSPSAISNAVVSIRDQQGWHQVGKLSQAYNVVNTSAYEHVLEVKLEWDGAVKPMIHEMIPVGKDGDIVIPPGELATELTGAGVAAPGQEFKVQLGLKNVVNSVYAQDIVIEYGGPVMDFVNAASLQAGINLLATVNDTPGKLRFLVASEGSEHAVSGDTQLLELTFRAKNTAEPALGTISVSTAVVADDQGAELNAAASSLAIQVTPQSTGIPGDVNGDDKVSIGDLAIIAANYGKDASSPDWQQVKRADVTKDGRIDLDDLVVVASKIVQ